MEFSTSIQDEPSFLEKDFNTDDSRKMTLAQYLHLDGDDTKKIKEESNCWKKFKTGLRMISVG